MEMLNDENIIKFWFSCVPKLEDLCYVIGYVSPSETFKATEKSNYHQKILKCRQLIFMEPQIIAAPSSTEECAVYIIMKKEVYLTGCVQKLLEKLKLVSSNAETVSIAVYEACICYTLIARLSPLWNQVGGYLIQGRDFLMNLGTLNAVKIEVVIREGEMFLMVWSLRVKLPKLHLEHLEAHDSLTEMHTLQDSTSIVNLPCEVNYAHVLPSLRRGCLVRLSNHLFDSCPYNSYKEVRRHWKNMYGYRLPEVPNNLLFYGVKFKSSSCNEFTYPSICLRPHGLIFFRSIDQKAILRTFLSNLITKMPTICGNQFGIEPKVGMAVPKLQLSNHYLEHPNLVMFDAEILSSSQSEKISQPVEYLESSISEKAYAPEIISSAAVKQTSLYPQKERLSLSSSSIYLPVAVPNTNDNEENVIKIPTHVPVFKPKSPPLTFTQTRKDIQLEFDSQQRSNLICQASSFTERPMKIGLYESRASPQTSSTPSKVPPLKVKLVPYAIPKPHFISEMHISEMYSLIDGTNKKPRSRPQVQIGVDVEALARGHDLSRVNTATLVNWLRNKNVSCKVKDRKADLVAKVMDYLKIDD